MERNLLEEVWALNCMRLVVTPNSSRRFFLVSASWSKRLATAFWVVWFFFSE